MLPCASPSTWISMWRGSSMYFSMKTRSSPKLARASLLRRAEARRAVRPRRAAMRMPLPPPPAEALIITG